MNRWQYLLLRSLFLMVLISGRCWAQDTVTDSLKQALATQPRDTHRVTLLNRLAARIDASEFATSMAYLDEALAIADSLNFTRGQADAKARYGELQINIGFYEQAMQNALDGLDRYALLRDSIGMGRTLMTVGLVQNHTRNFAKSIENLKKAAICYRSAKDLKGEISAKHNLAVVYVAMSDTASGREQYLENLRLLKDTKFSAIKAATYNNIGNLFDPVTEGDSAIHYYEIALAYKREAAVPNKGQIGNSLMNIANVHLLRGDMANAGKVLAEAEPYVVASHEKPRLLQLYQLKGEYHFKSGNFKESAENYKLQAMMADSLYTPQMAEQANRLEAAYQNERQKKEIELLNQANALDEIEAQRWRWITGGVAVGLLLTILLLVVVILRGRERARMLRMLHQKSEEVRRQQHEIVLQNEALSLQNKRLADLNHEKDGLIGIVAHDIRAPFNRTIALAELIQGIGNLSPEQERYLGMIRKASVNGGNLIQDLLELNSIEQNAHRVELALCDLKLALEHAQHGFLADAQQKNITIHIDAPSVHAPTDEKLLGRILDNLLSNAVKFTPKGKNVYLSIQSDAQMHWILIRDEGPGISEADQKRMFQKFMRLSARPTGGESSTGLGLSIVRALAERIGAVLTFESQVAVGTVFKLGIRRGE